MQHRTAHAHRPTARPNEDDVGGVWPESNDNKLHENRKVKPEPIPLALIMLMGANNNGVNALPIDDWLSACFDAMRYDDGVHIRRH